MIKQSQKTRKSAERKVRIIAAFRKSSGTIKAQVKNDEELSYFVTISKHGTMCRRWDGRECTGHHFTGHCYHVDAVRKMSDQIGAEGIAHPDCKTVQSVTAYLAYEAMAQEKQQALEEQKREACRNDILTRDMQAAADAERRERASLGGGRGFASVLLNK